MSADSLIGLIDGPGTNAYKARECLRMASKYGNRDLAFEELQTGAITFGLLAVADALSDPRTGGSLAEAIEWAAGAVRNR